ncbi:MAG: hypothetical protein ACOYOK_15315 [Pseudobdellovibrionaceae bacterium]
MERFNELPRLANQWDILNQSILRPQSTSAAEVDAYLVDFSTNSINNFRIASAAAWDKAMGLYNINPYQLFFP